MPKCKPRCPSWKPHLPRVPAVPPCSRATPQAVSTSSPSTEVLPAAAGSLRGRAAGQGAQVPCLPSSPQPPLGDSLETAFSGPALPQDDCSLWSCPSLFRDSGAGFSSGTLLRMEKRKQHHRRQVALTQQRHLAENRVK